MITIQATFTSENVTLKDNTLEAMAKFYDQGNTRFDQAARKVHRKTVFEILINLMRYVPVDTGRLRASWMVYLDRYSKQASYMSLISDESLVLPRVKKTAIGRAVQKVKKFLGTDEISQGKAQGFFVDNGLVTTIGTNVVYAGAVNKYSKYIDRTMQAATFIINENFEQFLVAAKKAGWIPTDYPDDPKPKV